jgi:hypothetical protein
MTMPKTAPAPFYHQDVYSSLCGFYACAHFLKAGTTEKVFVSKTTTFYAEQLKDAGVAREFCKELALNGNDPEAVAYILKGEADRKSCVTPGDFDYYGRMLLVLRTAHFMTILKGRDGGWWNYDSMQDQPTEIPDMKKFLEIYDTREFFVAK